MARGAVTLVEKVVAEVYEVVVHVEVVFDGKIVMKMAEDSRQERVVSCSCFCIIL